jgi:hypothetical protein
MATRPRRHANVTIAAVLLFARALVVLVVLVVQKGALSLEPP